MPKCRDCLYWEVCDEYRVTFWGRKARLRSPIVNASADSCIFYKDRSRFVELPIKPGTVLFVPIRNQITKYKITGICIREHGFGSERVLIEGISCSPFYSDISAIGKTAFLTREEAEQALKGLES